eukprot:Skav219876  [mRNA]  locus=scaffold777:248990:256618:+ [translate_table: standard]
MTHIRSIPPVPKTQVTVTAPDDSSWPVISVPHDFVVSGDFNRRADKSHGYLPYGVAWYRRRLCLQDAMAIGEGKKHAWLEFEGVMVKSKAPHCNNTLAVYVDATSPDGWWYDGGGIYRHVRVWSTDSDRSAPPDDEVTTTFGVSAVILGTANGDPASLDSNNSPQRAAFGGRLMAVVQPLPGAGHATIVAVAHHLPAATLQIKVLSPAPTAVLI